jgi:hypothetical protein
MQSKQESKGTQLLHAGRTVSGIWYLQCGQVTGAEIRQIALAISLVTNCWWLVL